MQRRVELVLREVFACAHEIILLQGQLCMAHDPTAHASRVRIHINFRYLVIVPSNKVLYIPPLGGVTPDSI